MVWPEEAGIGAAPARPAKAASERTRPGCDQERTSCAAASGPTPGSSSSCGASSRASVFDLAFEFALLGGELLRRGGRRRAAQAVCRAARRRADVRPGRRDRLSSRRVSGPQLAA